MNPSKTSREEMLSSCGELGPEDGVDPRDFHRKKTKPRVNRKALQLCSEVQRTLNAVFGGECGDALLRDLQVVSAEPAPNVARLRVTICQVSSEEPYSPELILTHLHRAQGMLRSQVAAAICRRRAPELVFRVVDDPGP